MEPWVDGHRDERPSFIALLAWAFLALSAPTAALALLQSVADAEGLLATLLHWLLDPPRETGATLDRHAALLGLLAVNAAVGAVAGCVLLRLAVRSLRRDAEARPPRR